MSKSKKYNYTITKESDDSWTAAIVRQISSKKTNISKTQGEFKTEEDAKVWAEAELTNFQQTQTTRNTRKNEQRKTNQTIRQERSQRNAEKTAAAKAKQAESEAQSDSDEYTVDDIEADILNNDI